MAKRKVPMARTANFGQHAQKRAKIAEKENVSDYCMGIRTTITDVAS